MLTNEDSPAGLSVWISDSATEAESLLVLSADLAGLTLSHLTISPNSHTICTTYLTQRKSPTCSAPGSSPQSSLLSAGNHLRRSCFFSLSRSSSTSTSLTSWDPAKHSSEDRNTMASDDLKNILQWLPIPRWYERWLNKKLNKEWMFVFSILIGRYDGDLVSDWLI